MSKSLAEKIRERRLKAGMEVPAGELPATRPVPVDRIREPRPEMPSHLDDLDNRLLHTLSRVKFATREQLVHWSDANRITVFRRLVTLQNAGLISSDSYQEPHIWSIKYRGAAMMLTKPPSGGRRSNWSVMTQACHRNAVEIMLDAERSSKGFRFILEKQFFWKRGLNPAFGEHGGEDDEKRAYLVLLDDYLMKPERISHTWERTHHPPRKYFCGNRSLSWSKNVNYFIVATTDKMRAEKHAAWIDRHSIPAKVITIKPLWG